MNDSTGDIIGFHYPVIWISHSLFFKNYMIKITSVVEPQIKNIFKGAKKNEQEENDRI